LYTAYYSRHFVAMKERQLANEFIHVRERGEWGRKAAT